MGALLNVFGPSSYGNNKDHPTCTRRKFLPQNSPQGGQISCGPVIAPSKNFLPGSVCLAERKLLGKSLGLRVLCGNSYNEWIVEGRDLVKQIGCLATFGISERTL